MTTDQSEPTRMVAVNFRFWKFTPDKSKRFYLIRAVAISVSLIIFAASYVAIQYNYSDIYIYIAYFFLLVSCGPTMRSIAVVIFSVGGDLWLSVMAITLGIILVPLLAPFFLMFNLVQFVRTKP